MVRTYDPSDLFAADAYAMAATASIIRAVTAGETGRLADQRAHIAAAAEGLAKALNLLNPAVEAETMERAA